MRVFNTFCAISDMELVPQVKTFTIDRVILSAPYRLHEVGKPPNTAIVRGDDNKSRAYAFREGTAMRPGFIALMADRWTAINKEGTELSGDGVRSVTSTFMHINRDKYKEEEKEEEKE